MSFFNIRDFVGSCHQQKIEASLVFDGLIEAIFILGMYLKTHNHLEHM